MDGDFDYDGYDEAEYSQGYEQSDIWTEEEEGGGVSVYELYSLCLLPSLSEGVMHVAYLLLWCFIFRITTQTGTYFTDGLFIFTLIVFIFQPRFLSSLVTLCQQRVGC
jgi:hypothetical protein